MKLLKDIYPRTCSNEELEASRREFATLAVSCAAECKNNRELMKELESRLPKDFLALIGMGSTRRAYATALGVTLKVQREDCFSDPLTDEELEERGGSVYLTKLHKRRRLANLSEFTYAIKYPRLMPKQYGFLGSFGTIQRHPSVLIAETAKTLDRFFPGDGRGVAKSDMGVDAATGTLHIFDDRITTVKRPSHLISSEDISSTSDPDVWLGNLGVTSGGRFVFVDRSDHMPVAPFLNMYTLSPREWGWNFHGDLQKTIEFSAWLFECYREACKKQQSMKGETTWQQKEAEVQAIPQCQ